MKTVLRHRLVMAWLILSGLTLLYVWIDRSADAHGAHTASTVVTVGAIAIALLKVHLIMREFMLTRQAPRLLRGITTLLVVVMAGALLAAYFAGKAAS